MFLSSLWLWAPFLAAPCLQQSPPCLSKAFPDPNPHVRLWPCGYLGVPHTLGLSLRPGGENRTCIKDSKRERRNKYQLVPEPCTLWGFQNSHVYTASFLGLPPLLRHGRGLVHVGVGCPRPLCLFRQECGDAKGCRMNKRPCVCPTESPWNP